MNRAEKYQANLASRSGRQRVRQPHRWIASRPSAPRRFGMSPEVCGCDLCQQPGDCDAGTVGHAPRYDLNADVGEGFPYDEELLAVITPANVACGFHAGDEPTMRQVCALGGRARRAVGAQPSYRDREGFGRRDVEIGYDDLVRRPRRAGGGAAGRRRGGRHRRSPTSSRMARSTTGPSTTTSRPRPWSTCARAVTGCRCWRLPGSRLHRLAEDAGVARDRGVLRRPRLRRRRAVWCRAPSRGAVIADPEAGRRADPAAARPSSRDTRSTARRRRRGRQHLCAWRQPRSAVALARPCATALGAAALQ